MIPESFNAGWGYRPRQSSFFSLAATPFEPVTLPHDAQISLPRAAASGSASNGFFPSVDVEYEKTFDVAADAVATRHVLEFEGVHRDARVYVNDALAAVRPYGYSRFFVPLDKFLRHGAENVVRVEATSHEDSRWYSGAGIYRPVTLHRSGLVHISVEGPRFSTPEIDDDIAVVQVDTTVVNESPVTSTTRVIVEIIDEGTGEVVTRDSAPITVFAGERAEFRRRLFVRSPKLWGADHPHLYRGHVTLEADETVVDEATDTFGIRRLQLDPVHGLRVNGEVVKLRGACVHHDLGPLGAAAFASAEERRVRLLKAAGFNAIRSAHNPASTALLRACDKLGVFVMDETFDVWTSRKTRFDYAGDFVEWWERDIESLVDRDFNRPSVIMYSIGNEIHEVGNELAASAGRDLANKIRSLDDTRYTLNAEQVLFAIPDPLALVATERNVGVNDVLASMDTMLADLWVSPGASQQMEEASGQIDIVGYNYGDARYDIDPEEFPNRITVGSETGRTNIGGKWHKILTSPHVIGDFCWTGMDYLGEVGIGRVRTGDGDAATAIFASFPYVSGDAGDIDLIGTRRPVSYFREIVFGLRREPWIGVLPPAWFDKPDIQNMFAWSGVEESWTWTGDEGKPVRVEVYSPSAEVELLVNGTSIGRSPAGPEHDYTASFETAYEPGEIVAVAYDNGEESSRSVLRTAGAVEALQVTPEAETLIARDDALSFVSIRLIDAEGRVNPLGSRAVSVEVEGPGVLQALGTGDPSPDEPLVGGTRSSFRGELMAYVRPTGPGIITVTARTEGLAPASVEITVAETNQT